MDPTILSGDSGHGVSGMEVVRELTRVGRWRRWIVVDRQAGTRRLLLSMVGEDELAAAGVEAEDVATRARQAQAVVHPGLTRVAEFGSNKGVFWIMEEVGEAEPLAVLSPEEVPAGKPLVAGLVHLVEALGHAHAQGLSHGHLSAGAVLVERGTLRLSGLATGDGSAPDQDVVGWARVALELMAPLSDPRHQTGPLAALLSQTASGAGWVPGDGRQMADKAHEVLGTDAGQAEVAALRHRRTTDEDEDARETPTMWSRFLRAMKASLVGLAGTVLTVGLLAGAAVGGMYYALEGAPAEVGVPNVLGMKYDDAVAALEESCLEVGTLSRAYRDDVEAGTVAATNPPPAMQVREGRKIAVVVSRGSAEVKVARVVGLQVSEAEKILEKLGLILRKDGQRRSKAPVGEVVTQRPAAASRAARGTEVAVVLSGGDDYGILRVEGDDGEEQQMLFRTIEVVIPQGEAIQRVRVAQGQGEELESAYDRPHRPGDRVSLDVHGVPGTRIEVRIEDDVVYKTQL